MSNLVKGVLLIVVILAIGAGLVVWKKNYAGHGEMSFNSISKEEVELLLADAAKANPMALKRLAEDPELKKQQLNNLKELLAFASQAQKEGLASEPSNKQELENIRDEIIAVNYDREINADKGPMPPFGFVGEDRINAFWAEDSAKKEAAFQEFLDTKVKLLKESNPQMKDREISEEEKTQAKDFFAKIQIYKKEYEDKAKAGELKKEFQDKVNLQVKLQQAQFLARLYSEKLAEKTKVTDEEIAKYISEHPELNPAEKKTKAEEILNRAKAGEDFAALANEFSEDPGNVGAKGEKKGGLYTDVPTGRMVKPFEEAALALEPGQVAPNVVESDFGFHIIKLEKKADAKGADGNQSQIYDVRHILIGTTFKDPENPMARDMPVKEYVRQKLETEKEKQIVDEIVASNKVTVPEDFDVPQISDEQIQEMMKKQQGPMPMPEGEPGAEPEAPDSKKADTPKK